MRHRSTFYLFFLQSILSLNVLQWGDQFVAAKNYTFALIPKCVDNPYFDLAREGCEEQAKILGVTCLYTGPYANESDRDGYRQSEIIRDLVDSGSVDGIAVSVQSEEAVGLALDYAVQAGLPVLTFDSDAQNSTRTAYIGTDNHFFGVELAKVLKQLKPNGGTYATIGSSSPNIQERIRGFQEELNNKELSNAVWTELPGSPADIQSSPTLAIQLMYDFADMNPTAIAPVLGSPMRSGRWGEFVTETRDKNITFVCGDAMPNQLDFMARGKVAGLVGQLPYEMGAIPIKLLHEVIRGGVVDVDFVGTNVLSHLEIPLVLPPLNVDHNLLGQWRIVGYTLFTLCAFCALAFGVWVVTMRKKRVVRAAQPMFLLMVAFGVFIMASVIVPMSFDDGGEEHTFTKLEGSVRCMSIPWLGFCGFTITFSALFSKTLRFNKIVSAQRRFSRMQVSMIDVLIPFFVLFTANIIILACWTFIDPLHYVRKALDGTDGWNRTIATYGSCMSNHVERFLIPLCLVNMSVLVIANRQVYIARNIESEFSEAKYIGLSMASLLQAGICGLPILGIVRESPQAFYLVLATMIFVICMAVLLLIFVPKIVLAENFRNLSEHEQRSIISNSIHRISKKSSQSNVSELRKRRRSSGQEERALRSSQGSDSEGGSFDNYVYQQSHITNEPCCPLFSTRMDSVIEEKEEEESRDSKLISQTVAQDGDNEVKDVTAIVQEGDVEVEDVTNMAQNSEV